MRTDHDFLTEIEENSLQREPRLIYADWLEELGEVDDAEIWRVLGQHQVPGFVVDSITRPSYEFQAKHKLRPIFGYETELKVSIGQTPVFLFELTASRPPLPDMLSGYSPYSDACRQSRVVEYRSGGWRLAAAELEQVRAAVRAEVWECWVEENWPRTYDLEYVDGQLFLDNFLDNAGIPPVWDYKHAQALIALHEKWINCGQGRKWGREGNPGSIRSRLQTNLLKPPPRLPPNRGLVGEIESVRPGWPWIADTDD